MLQGGRRENFPAGSRPLPLAAVARQVRSIRAIRVLAPPIRRPLAKKGAARRGSDPRNLRQVIEVAVAGKEIEAMLYG